MKKFKMIAFSLIGISMIIMSCSFDDSKIEDQKTSEIVDDRDCDAVENQRIHMFITHGHCSTPFTGEVTNLFIDKTVRSDQGNPLENMKVSFTVDPTTFTECRRDIENSPILTQGLFINGKEEYMKFTTKETFTMGLDWYQINGIMSIKGVEHEAKLFATGVREVNETEASKLIIYGELDLFDWNIDYEKIVNGKSSDHPTRWMNLNMTVDL